MIYLNTDAVSDSLVVGISSNTLAVIPTDNLSRSFPFTFHPTINWLFNPVSSNTIKSMRFYLRDVLNRPIDLNGIDWTSFEINSKELDATNLCLLIKYGKT